MNRLTDIELWKTAVKGLNQFLDFLTPKPVINNENNAITTRRDKIFRKILENTIRTNSEYSSLLFWKCRILSYSTKFWTTNHQCKFSVYIYLIKINQLWNASYQYEFSVHNTTYLIKIQPNMHCLVQDLLYII